MRILAITGISALLTVAPVHAQTPASPAAQAPAPVAAKPAVGSATAAVSEAASRTSQEIAEVKAMFEQIYADVNRNTSPGAREIIAVGTGAGLGFLASGFIMTAWIAPLVSSLSSTLGMSQSAAGIVTASVTTIGIVSGAYAGGVYARDLVVSQ